MWFYLSLFFAFDTAVMFALTKHLTKHLHPVMLMTLQILFTLPVMLLALYLIHGGIPQVTPLFFLLMLCSGTLDLLAFVCITYAIKHSPISILSPMSSFTPVFTTLTGLLFLHEIPTPLKLTGILTIVIGAYCLHVSQINHGLLTPIKKLFSDHGVKLYFLAMMIFGVTPIFQKQAIFQTTLVTPLFASFIGNLIVGVYLVLIMLGTTKSPVMPSKKSLWILVVFGVLNTLAQLAAYHVFSTTYVGYATAVFSLSSLFSVILGGLLFNEVELRERLFGTLVMITGVVLIAL